MALGTKFIATFLDANGDDVVFVFDYADRSADETDVKNFMAGVITNGSIFQNVPVTAKSAKMVTTTETAYDLSA